MVALAVIILAVLAALYTGVYYWIRLDERSLRYGRFVLHVRVLLATLVLFFLLLYLLLKLL